MILRRVACPPASGASRRPRETVVYAIGDIHGSSGPLKEILDDHHARANSCLCSCEWP